MSGSFTSAQFREALSHFASGVTIITARSQGAPVGFTASAFTSVSLTPPLVLVCIAHTASAHDAVVAADRFGVNVLAERQGWLAEQFAKHGIDRFEGVTLHGAGEASVPLLEGALVHLECRKHTLHTAGDHTILIGEVEGGATWPGRPLVHYSRKLGEFIAHGTPRGGSAALETPKNGEG